MKRTIHLDEFGYVIYFENKKYRPRDGTIYEVGTKVNVRRGGTNVIWVGNDLYWESWLVDVSKGR